MIIQKLIFFNFSESFSQNNNKAIDEVWYKRAVDQYFVHKESFVYSVPFDSGGTFNTRYMEYIFMLYILLLEGDSEIIVTATNAIFHNESSKSAPAAVVGFQFQHSALYKLFHNITGNVNNISLFHLKTI